MDTSNHFTLHALFEQLGLPASSEQIKAFIQAHPLEPEQRITNANFWNESQAAFLQESICEDSDWVEIVDSLDAQLRQH